MANLPPETEQVVSSSTRRGLHWDWAKLDGEFYAGRWRESGRGLVLCLVWTVDEMEAFRMQWH